MPLEPADQRLIDEMQATIAGLAGDDVDRLDLKITNAALKEMRRAFKVFAPYRGVPKVTIFGSARTLPEDPLYRQARDLAAALAAAGWMVVTGAGPGIMAAGAEGAGPDWSIGVNIRLPFEAEPNPVMFDDSRLVAMKYFFTRKLMLMKESAGFAVLPGGFGTMDEAFELLTLLQTGKASPAPIVLLDVPGGTYWRSWQEFAERELAAGGLVSPDDLHLVHVTDDVGDAVAEILGFFRNYHSIRHVGRHLVMRLKARPTDAELEELNREFRDVVVDGAIEITDPLPPEVADGDHVDLPRLAFALDPFRQARFRALIDAVNRLASAPALSRPDAEAVDAAATPPDLLLGL
ncbi:MAG: TIGR00730 family Rossman fold protein [Acidimicrobiales bacterium]